jgi:predicted DNA-binding mobile mystery protein A
MVDLNKKLIIDQLDKKFKRLSSLNESDIPPKGWIYSIRTALNMSLSQLAKRLKKTVPSIKEIEEREQNRNITINKLVEVADALDLRFYYCFIPKDGTIQSMIEKRALEVARDIVLRTSHSMGLEEQKNTEDRLEKAIKDRAEQIKHEMPKYLWD